MVLVAIDDPVASKQIYYYCKEQRISANISDVPPLCDFYFGSVHRDGPLQIMVSTNGKGPRLAALIRQRIAAGLPTNAGDAILKVGELRQWVAALPIGEARLHGFNDGQDGVECVVRQGAVVEIAVDP